MAQTKLAPKLYDYNGDIAKRWFIAYYDNGKRKRRYLPGQLSPSERYQQTTKIVGELSKLCPVSRVWLENAQEWLEVKKGIWRLKTYQTFKSKLQIISQKLQILSADTVAEFFNNLIKEGKHATTINAYRQFFNMLNNHVWNIKGLVTARKLRAIKTPAKYFSSKQMKFLLDKIKGENSELWLFVQFQYYCFIRPAELRMLQVSDLLVDESKILVRADISKNRIEQYVSIPSVFLPVLVELVSNCINPADFVFGGDKPRSTNHFSAIHRKILSDNRFDTKRYKLYSWKHSGVVAAAMAGINLKQLQIQLRHHSLDQVNDYLRQLGVTDCTELKNNFPAI